MTPCTPAPAADSVYAENRVDPRNTIDAYCRRTPETCDRQRSGYRMRTIDGTAGRIAKSKIEMIPEIARNHCAELIHAIRNADMAPATPGTTTNGFFRLLAITAPENTDPNNPSDAIASGSCSWTSVAPMAFTAIRGALPMMPAKTASNSANAM